MGIRIFFVLLFLVFSALQASAIDRPAKELFGYQLSPAPMEARAIGSYARGCLAGGVQLPVSGSAWQAMRLSRNRTWGHPLLVKFIERLAKDAKEKDGWPGLLVGDLAQPRGGPMLSGHASHQIGLDADVWLTPMPGRKLSYKEREQKAAVSTLDKTGLAVNPKVWTLEHVKLLHRAASYPEVARIFVHPAIKKALCDSADKIGDDRSWLSHIRPWYGHFYHFHLRLKCPAGMTSCENQAAVSTGDGCGKEVDDWLQRLKPKKVAKPAKPAKPGKTAKKKKALTLAQLPAACTTVLVAGDKNALKRMKYGVVGDIPAPVRNPKRAESKRAQVQVIPASASAQ